MITRRQAQILAGIVREYSETGKPVGSKELAEKYRFDVSPATIRNEMQILEKEKYLTHPHTSAGRIPTDQGYRYFVNHLMRHLELTRQQQQRLRQELEILKRKYLELGRGLAKLLAEKSGGAAFALLPESTSATGFSNIVDERISRDEIKEMAGFLDNIEEHSKALRNYQVDEVKTFIGKEAPVPLSEDFSLMITRVQLPEGKKGVVGVIGPKRMKYSKNVSLLNYISKFLGGGLSIALIISNF